MRDTRRYRGHIHQKRSPWRVLLPWTAGILAAILATVGGAFTVRMLRLSDSNASPPSPTGSLADGGGSPSRSKLTGPDAIRLASLVFVDDPDINTWAAQRPVEVNAEQSRLWRTMQLADWPAYTKQMRSAGAVDGGQLTIEITLVGKHPDGVRIMDIRPLTTCAERLSGTLFYAPNAGTSEVVGLGIDFDQVHPNVRVLKPGGGLGGEYFRSKKYDLDDSEKVTFKILAVTKHRYCEFKLKFDLLVGDERAEKIIDDAGRPFKITGLILAADYTPVVNRYQISYFGGVAFPKSDHLAWNKVN